MSRSHPIISITGSSGAGTSSVKKTFENIFRREKVAAAYIEGDAFHRYNRVDMRTKMAEEAERGNKHFSHFSPETNLFEELEQVFRTTVNPAPERRAITSTMAKRRSCTARNQAPSPNGGRCRTSRTCCSMKACTAPS